MIEYASEPPYSAQSGLRVNREEWKEAIRPDIARQVAALNNHSLLEEYTQMAGGDDYDGCRTTGGSVVWEELEKELILRLEKLKFFD